MTAGSWDTVVPFAPFPTMPAPALLEVLDVAVRALARGERRGGLGQPFDSDEASRLRDHGFATYNRVHLELERRLDV